jgi:two-component system response regulator MprA
MHIVVAEDEKEEADRLGQWLTSAGHQVAFADTGPAAVATCLETRPAAAFVNLLLPGLDGFAVARRIRAAVPSLVAITTLRSVAVEEIARAVGFKSFLRRPYTDEDVRALLAPLFPDRQPGPRAGGHVDG